MVSSWRTIYGNGARMSRIKDEIKKLSLFSLTGVLNTGIGYLLIFSFMFIGISPLLSNLFGYTIGFFLSFFMGKYVIFRSPKGKRSVEILKYLIVFISAYLMNLLTLNTSLKFHASPYLCQLFGGVVFSATNYLFSRLWVFRSSLS